MKFLPPVYDTETIRQMLETVTGKRITGQDIWNLSRPGNILAPATLHRGAFDVRKTRPILMAILRRRLAAELGRKSPRLPSAEIATLCPECEGEAVLWNSETLCENGHRVK